MLRSLEEYRGAGESTSQKQVNGLPDYHAELEY